MLIDVLTRVSADTGLGLIDRRTSLLQILSASADEMYKELECTKMLRECVLAVPPDKIVALPAFIGQIRGLRMHSHELPIELHSIGQPKYVNTTLNYLFKNWRDLGDSPVHTKPAGFGGLTFIVSKLENPNVTVIVNGSTPASNNVEESVVINALTTVTNAMFGININNITCLTKRDYDIRVLDNTGTEVAVLYNNFPKTRYKLVDVSRVFWPANTADNLSFIDVLYKVPKTKLEKDTDSFWGGDEFDEAWYALSMHKFLDPLQNRKQDSLTFRKLALDIIAAAKEGTESGILKKVSFGRNKFYSLFRRFRYYPGAVTNVDMNQ